HVDDAHAALANLLQELVRADDRTGAFRHRWADGRADFGLRRRGDAAEFFVSLDQQPDALAQVVRSGACLAQKSLALTGRNLERGQKEFTQFVGFDGHGELSTTPVYPMRKLAVNRPGKMLQSVGLGTWLLSSL